MCSPHCARFRAPPTARRPLLRPSYPLDPLQQQQPPRTFAPVRRTARRRTSPFRTHGGKAAPRRPAFGRRRPSRLPALPVVVANVCTRGPCGPTVDRAASAWSCRRRQQVLSRASPILPCDGSPGTAARSPPTHTPAVSAIHTNALIPLHAACNAAWAGATCTVVNTTDFGEVILGCRRA